MELRRHRSRVLVHPRRRLRPGLLRAVSLGVSLREGSLQSGGLRDGFFERGGGLGDLLRGTRAGLGLSLGRRRRALGLLQSLLGLRQRSLELFLVSLDPLALLHSLGELFGRLLILRLSLLRLGSRLLELSLGLLCVGASRLELGFQLRVTLVQLDGTIQPRALSLRLRSLRGVSLGVCLGDGEFQRGDSFGGLGRRLLRPGHVRG